jgi:nitrate reductase gamma subunit
MTLLEFARGPALALALTVFAVGTLWRLLAILRLPAQADLSMPRAGAPARWLGALHGIGRGFWPRREFRARSLPVAVNGIAFHVGLALVAFGYAPHIAFVHRLTGLSWPALPDPVVYVAAGVTIVTLLVALWMRLGDAVRQRLSTADDWISWTVTMLPMVTGMAVATEPSAALLAREHVVYGGPLALHLLTVELLLIWFPFGKLMHGVLFVFSRGATGARYSHRGVKA